MRAVVALDRSRFKAVNNRDKNFTTAKEAKRIEQVEASIARYLTASTPPIAETRAWPKPRPCASRRRSRVASADAVVEGNV
jgi:hypothetical protein